MVKVEKKPIQKLAISIGIGVSVALGASMFLLLAFAAAICGGWVELGNAWQLTIAACAVGGFLGGILAVRCVGQWALPVGAVTGLLFFLGLFMLGFLVSKEAALSLKQLPLLFSCLSAGGVAGLAGKKRKKRRN